ncbi:MAG TPA: c-type cytochrome [Burkholderiaceae bacterium]|nr:c-type cytochrome [Burkholderiaceae bacterium]
MSRLLQRCAWPVLVAAVFAAAALARADDTRTTASPNQDAGAAKPEAANPEAANPAPAPAPLAPAAPSTVAPPAGGGAPLYRVVDGDHVDANTMKGWRTWRALACERCHGANQEGLVGPSLVDDLKTMSREDFNKCVLEGRIDKGMPNFGGTKTVVDNLDGLYAFLKGRSDGAIPTGHLKEIQ